MSKNTGIPYEKLTQTIFNEIVNQHSVETIEVQQNVILKGKTVSHQIDVYWKFTHGGIDYHTIIQCSGIYNSQISAQFSSRSSVRESAAADTRSGASFRP